MSPERFKPVPYVPDLPFDWVTGGRQLSEEEREVAKRIAHRTIRESENLSTDDARKPLTGQQR